MFCPVFTQHWVVFNPACFRVQCSLCCCCCCCCWWWHQNTVLEWVWQQNEPSLVCTILSVLHQWCHCLRRLMHYWTGFPSIVDSLHDVTFLSCSVQSHPMLHVQIMTTEPFRYDSLMSSNPLDGQYWRFIPSSVTNSIRSALCNSGFCFRSIDKKSEQSCIIFLLFWIQIFYIYAFSRCFYPKRLTVHSGYTFFISMCVPWELNPRPFALLTQCSTTEPHEHMMLCVRNRHQFKSLFLRKI